MGKYETYKGDDVMKRVIAVITIVAMLSLLALPSFAAPAQTTSRLIVVFETQQKFEAAKISLEKTMKIEALLSRQNGLVVHGNLNAIAQQAKRLGIKRIEVDQVVQLVPPISLKVKPSPDGGTPPPESLEWGIIRMGAPAIWNSATGQGVRVGVIDTGIDTSHSDLKVWGGISYVPRVSSYKDDNGHGTHVAGTIAAIDNSIGVVGVAPEAMLYAIKVLDKRGSGYLSSVVQGINWSIDHDMDVINMSLGANVGSVTLEQALIDAEGAGIIAVSAAGNDGAAVDFPGAYPSNLAIGAIDTNNVIAYFSSRGPELDFVAPGVNIRSTYMGNTYKSLSGTSMATPHVAGLAALFKQLHNNATLESFYQALETNAIDLGVPGFDDIYGFGLPNGVAVLSK